MGIQMEHTAFRRRSVRLFCAGFALYVFLGMCLSYQVAYEANMFFGADNLRAFRDLTDIGYDHYRVKVHPLFLLLTETVTLLVDGAVNRPTMSVILVEAACGALSAALFDAVLGRMRVSMCFRNLFTFLFAFSFSTMLFASIPETYLFAALGLIAFWYFLLLAAEGTGPLSRREVFLLVFFGVVCFGVTLTNYVFYLVGLLWLLVCRYRRREGLKAFLAVNVWNAAAVFAGCLFQRFVWNQSPLFWTSILGALSGQSGYEETSYMSWAFSWSKTGLWFKQTVLAPLLSSQPYLLPIDATHRLILFSDYPLPAQLLLGGFCGALAAAPAVYLLRRLRRWSWREDGCLLALLAAYGGNLVLHYIYGHDEAFIYSPHYLFYLLLAAAFALDRLTGRRGKKPVAAVLLAFCGLEAGNNLLRFFQTVQIALATAGCTLDLSRAGKGTLLCEGLLLAGILCRDWLRAETPRPAPPESHREVRIQQLCRFAGVYGALILVVGLFLAFNY